MTASEWRPLITCEHGGNRVPAAYRDWFQGREALLQSHRGWDPGALLCARELAAGLEAPLVYATVTRLLVDLNRSPHHRDVIPYENDGLPAGARERLMETWYRPYRNRVREHVEKTLAAGARVLHLSIHSFTPELDGRVREVDIGLLYDPARRGEKWLGRRLKPMLAAGLPGCRIRLNSPYRGTADGLTTSLRRDFHQDVYLGLEVELNQRFAAAAPAEWKTIRRHLIKVFRHIVLHPLDS